MKEAKPIWTDIFSLTTKKRARPYTCFPNGKEGKAYKGHRWVSGVHPVNGRGVDLCCRCGHIHG